LPDVEVIVADGGSADATADIARRMGICVVPVRPGRGRQMNAGAALASGEVLLFLHVDTKLPGGFRKHVWSTLDRGAVAGAFVLRIDDEHSGLRWIEWGAILRSHYLQMPYGDQGLFVRSELFHRVGGFPNWPLMEDYELCRRLRRHGRILLAPAAVSTSAAVVEAGPMAYHVHQSTLHRWIPPGCVAGAAGALVLVPGRPEALDAPSIAVTPARYEIVLITGAWRSVGYFTVAIARSCYLDCNWAALSCRSDSP
jgi:rSAM/selenodomain-associated transferase 2